MTNPQADWSGEDRSTFRAWSRYVGGFYVVAAALLAVIAVTSRGHVDIAGVEKLPARAAAAPTAH